MLAQGRYDVVHFNMGLPGMVADINVVTPRSITKGLTSPWDTNLVPFETQMLARRSI